MIVVRIVTDKTVAVLTQEVNQPRTPSPYYNHADPCYFDEELAPKTRPLKACAVGDEAGPWPASGLTDRKPRPLGLKNLSRIGKRLRWLMLIREIRVSAFSNFVVAAQAALGSAVVNQFELFQGLFVRVNS